MDVPPDRYGGHYAGDVSDVTLVNWPQVDYWLTPLIGATEAERSSLCAKRGSGGVVDPALDGSSAALARGDPNQGALDHGQVTKPQHRADMFIDPESDPREGGTSLGDERATLIEFLRAQRLTLQLKCEGLDADAARSPFGRAVNDVAARSGAAPGRSGA